MTTERDQWRRVGAYLKQRRERLGYKQRTAWVRAVSRPKFSMRVIIDMEGGERDTYGDEAVQAAEDAYELVPGTFRRALAGEIPEPIPVEVEHPEAEHPDEVEHQTLDTAIGQVVRTIYGLTPEQRDEISRRAADRVREDIRLLVAAKHWENQQQENTDDADEN